MSDRVVRPGVWLLLTLVGLGILFGLSVYTFLYAEGASYLSNDPAACTNCHVMNEHFDSWNASSHHAVATCNDCHVSHTFPMKYIEKARNGWNHSKAFTLQNYPTPIRITQLNLKALQRNCIECHATTVSEIVGYADVELGSARCTLCHQSVGHLASY